VILPFTHLPLSVEGETGSDTVGRTIRFKLDVQAAGVGWRAALGESPALIVRRQTNGFAVKL
jgi:hypothetical protein